MKNIKRIFIGIAGSSLLVTNAIASEVTIPNSFNSGSPAVAAEVNGNFTAIKGSVDDNHGRITALEASIASLINTVSTLQTDLDAANTTIAGLQTNISNIQANSVLDLDTFLTYELDERGYPTAKFTGVNVQVVNGVSQTTVNGVGNLIVGYNNLTTLSGYFICSDSSYT